MDYAREYDVVVRYGLRPTAPPDADAAREAAIDAAMAAVRTQPTSVQRQALREVDDARVGRGLGTARLEADLGPLDPTSRKTAVRGILADVGSLPEPHAFDASHPRSENTADVAHALQEFTRGGGYSGRRAPVLTEAAPAGLRVARAIVNGVDEVTHQLQKGLDPSGVEWYAKNLHRLDAGLIALYGHRDPAGGYTGRFGRVGPDGHVLETTPHLKLFKTLLATLSYQHEPRQNLYSAVDAYDLAARAYPGANPLAVIPEHKGVITVRDLTDPRKPKILSERFSLPEARKPYTPGRHKAYGTAQEGHLAGIRTLKAVLDYFGGDEGRAADFFLTPQPYAHLLQFRAGHKLHEDLPRPAGLEENYRQLDRASHYYPGAWVLGPKGGPFALNVNRMTEEVTKDLWFSRSWNRLMGTLHREGGVLQDTPRHGDERAAMDEAVGRMAEGLGLTPSEVQSVWWYYEQSLYRALGARAESNSFADGIDALLARHGVHLPDPIPADQARRAAVVEAAQARGVVRHARVRGAENLDAVPRPAREVFDDLRRRAEELEAAGRLPDAATFLEAVARAAGLVRPEEERP